MSRRRILIVDDDAGLLRLMSLRLEKEGFGVLEASSAEAALAVLASETPDLVITDMRMGGMDGLALFDTVNRSHPSLPVILLTAHGNVPDAVSATRKGVFSYLQKPVEARALMAEVDRALALSAGSRESDAWRDGIVTRNAAMLRVLAEARLVAQGDAPVLLTGQSGTGKELLARAIHAASSRRDSPFVALNCGALPEPLLESELFGHVKGAFTDARQDRVGRFELADGSSLFLDEIANVPLGQQQKLLRVLETGEFERLGSSRTRRADVRLISATNADLHAEVTAGRFRQDLLFRLNTIEVHLPPLRERREDIARLAAHFLSVHAQRYRKPISTFEPAALTLLHEHPWPGNVRELDHAVERAVLMAPGPAIQAADLGLRRGGPTEERLDEMSLEDIEALFIRKAMSRYGNVSHAAKALGLSRSALYRRLERHRPS